MPEIQRNQWSKLSSIPNHLEITDGVVLLLLLLLTQHVTVHEVVLSVAELQPPADLGGVDAVVKQLGDGNLVPGDHNPALALEIVFGLMLTCLEQYLQVHQFNRSKLQFAQTKVNL